MVDVNEFFKVREVPKEIRHNFLFSFDLTAQASNGGQCFRCSYCQTWTQAPDATVTTSICPQRERRRAERRKADRRAR